MTFELELDQAIRSAQASLKEAGLFQDSKGQETLSVHIERIRSMFNGETIAFCIERFIEAELDFQSSGSRGLRRISETIPRYGAYYRKHLRSMDANARMEISRLIRNQLLTGYVAVAMFSEHSPDVEADNHSAEEIYRAWIPMIYSDGYGDTLLQIVYACGADAKASHKAYLAKHKIKGGGLFSTDKSGIILLYYHLAGAALRLAEKERQPKM